MRVLGVDPGTVICGYGVLDIVEGRVIAVSYGVIRAQTARARSLPERLHRVLGGLGQVIAAFTPQAVAIEEAFVWKNARSALALGHGRAAAMLAAAAVGLPVFEYQPAIVKKAVTGSGRAPKEQVQLMVQGLLGLDARPEPADAADALAVAFTHLHRGRQEALLQADAARRARVARSDARPREDGRARNEAGGTP